MPPPLRLLTLCYEWPPVGGGGGRAGKDIAEALVERGHKVRVQTIRFGQSPRFAIENGVEVYRTKGFRRHADRCSPLEMAGYLLTSFPKTLWHLANFKPDLIHAHFAVPTGAIALPAALAGGRPYVLTAHLGDVPGAIPDQTDRLFNSIQPFVRPIWQHAAAVVGVSEFVADLAQKFYKRKVPVIPNGISLHGRDPVAPRTIDQTQLVFVGRLNAQKNLRFLPPILAAIKDLSWALTIVGDGDERAALETDFRAAGLQDKVSFRGWLERDQVDAILKKSDIFLMPSTVEGLSVAALEALKFGLIIIGSDIPALRDCVESGQTGYLISLGEPASWVEILKTLISDRGQHAAMRRAAWEHAEKFNIESVARQYEALFYRAVSEDQNRDHHSK